MPRYIIAHELRTKRKSFTRAGVMERYGISEHTIKRILQMVGGEIVTVTMPKSETVYEWK